MSSSQNAVPRRLLPNVFQTAVVGIMKPTFREEVENLDVDKLRHQHEALVRILQELNIHVITAELHGSYENSLLLDRLAICCNGVVFFPKPRTVADQKNYEILKKILQNECSQIVVDQESPLAKVCGSDILFTGFEIVIGLSDTTNEEGASEVADAFSDLPVTAIKMPNGADHIKNYVTVAGDRLIAVGPGDIAKEIVVRLKRRVSRYYDFLEVSEDAAANCIYANDTLIHRAIEDVPESFKIFICKTTSRRRSICFSEFDKLRAGLSSVCLLAKKVI